MTAEQNKLLVQRLVEEAVNPGNPDVLDDVAEGEFAVAVRRWIGPFRDSFPDFRMEIADLVADGEKVAAHFRCSVTHLGEWTGYPPTGRRFQNVNEIYIFRVSGGKLAGAFGVEDNVARMRQLGSARERLPRRRHRKGTGHLQRRHRTPIRARQRRLYDLLVSARRTAGMRPFWREVLTTHRHQLAESREVIDQFHCELIAG